jgi:hypothetical protein
MLEQASTARAHPASLQEIFAVEYRLLRPRAPMPAFDVRFYPFTGINTTIRLREGKALVRLSDMLEGAPENVLRAIAHILLAKLYRKPIEAVHANRYRRHLGSEAVTRRAEQIRRSRGRKNISTPEGHHYHLEEIFEQLNREFFNATQSSIYSSTRCCTSSIPCRCATAADAYTHANSSATRRCFQSSKR